MAWRTRGRRTRVTIYVKNNTKHILFRQRFGKKKIIREEAGRGTTRDDAEYQPI